MLFNSYPFIFLFLPITLFTFFFLGRKSHRLAAAWLVLSSLFFYGWWNPRYLLLLLASIIFNFIIGMSLIKEQRHGSKSKKSRGLLVVGLAFDLSLLGYYKYTNFFMDNLNALTGSNYNIGEIILPLGISFFTFTQIAFLVDAYRGEVKGYDFIHYILFITYFPHLIAGPIIHHKEIIPQFESASTYKINYDCIAAGLTVFFIGLFKKTVLADGIAPHAVVIYSIADKGQVLTFLEAWLGGICYAFQLYFDFSGYSDMAIGGSLMFGIKLPLNFHSPYKAVNIFEFWRRWHMTLSRFLRNYVYSPLSHGKKKPWRLMLNLALTMVIGGLWHGAGWNYLLWGGLHGLYLTINHLWRDLRKYLGQDMRRTTSVGRFLSCTLTFAAFVFSLAFFRAKDMNGAGQMVGGMLALNGVALPLEWKSQLGALEPFLTALGIAFIKLNARVMDTGFTSDAFKWIFYLGIIIWLMPNSQQIMSKYFPALNPYLGDRHYVSKILWEPNIIWLIITGVVAIIGLANITKVSEFLYYQF
ncbi:MAG: MBOAT family protein [Proteobacteria bacterium]|nr:MBOAT family protein [Pseudomonadota bacterium]